MKRVVVDPISRIEGHLRVEIKVDEASGKVEDALSSGTAWRGIELVAKDRDPRDLWAFVQRICGVCTTTHALAALRAVEDAIGITIPKNFTAECKSQTDTRTNGESSSVACLVEGNVERRFWLPWSYTLTSNNRNTVDINSGKSYAVKEKDILTPIDLMLVNDLSYSMNKDGNTFDKSYRKSAKSVGNIMGNFHPHGDSSIYDAMVRMSQDWKNREILVEMHGNNGSMDGDPPAAMRYTEARLSEIAGYLLQDIDKNTVPWAWNFDDTEKNQLFCQRPFLISWSMVQQEFLRVMRPIFHRTI